MAVTVAELLRIYSIRQAIAAGQNRPTNDVGRRFFDAVVTRLSELPADASCSVEHEPGPGGEWLGITADGRMVARLWIPDSDRNAVNVEIPVR